VRIVALSGFGQDAERSKALEAGFDQHLIKPVDPAFLRSLLG
jgi:CheY-like chemotaxis protein